MYKLIISFLTVCFCFSLSAQEEVAILPVPGIVEETELLKAGTFQFKSGRIPQSR